MPTDPPSTQTLKADIRVPVMLLTGFLGAGKTTLLNRVLADGSSGHVAVIVNEFGEAGLDHDLIEAIEDEVVLMQSGCLCCSVRGDLSRTIVDLLTRRDRGQIRFDRAIIETTGMAALIKNFRYQQRSEGAVTKAGLRPERYSVDQRGKPKQQARFDWKRGAVQIDRGDSHREAKIAAGDQDVLSLWHQLARVRLDDRARSLTVVTNKAAAVSVVRDLGVETLTLPMGEIAARHMAVHSDDGNVKVDLWLAEDRKNLPVRIRIEDSKGETLDQQAERIELGVAGPVW